MTSIIKIAIIRQKYRIDGGGEQFISLMLRELHKCNIELNLITRQWSNDVQNLNCKIHICNPFIWNRTSKETKFSKAAIQYCKKKFHIIQSHERIPHCHIFRAGDGMHQAWLIQRKRILPYYRYLSHTINTYHQYILKKEKEMLYSPKLKKIICNSKMVKSNIINLYNIHESKIALIYNFVDSKKFFPATNEQYYIAKKILEIPLKACTLIYVGSGFERKGLRQAIYGIALTNRYLIIVGNDQHIKRYKSLTKELGCFSRTRFIGITHNLLPYYHAADGFILPTIYDPFPNAILEAMSCALPIITTWQCGGSELIKTGQEGFVCDALDINNLQKFIMEIPLKNQYPHLGIAARKKIMNFNAKNFIKQLMNLYKNVLCNT